jgi:hypothetical protein
VIKHEHVDARAPCAMAEHEIQESSLCIMGVEVCIEDKRDLLLIEDGGRLLLHSLVVKTQLCSPLTPKHKHIVKHHQEHGPHILSVFHNTRRDVFSPSAKTFDLTQFADEDVAL